jgi:Protein of unknown function (DUF4038)
MDEKKSDPEFTCLQLSEKRKLERYGHHSVWQMHSPGRGEGINKPINYWFQAIESPGAWQIRRLTKVKSTSENKAFSVFSVICAVQRSTLVFGPNRL